MKAVAVLLTALAFLAGAAPAALAIGELKPVETTRQADLVTVSHAVRVTINNGFARTEVRHTFRNDGPRDIEADYSFPVPLHASLSEFGFTSGETTHQGEVLAVKEAKRLYEEEKSHGRDAGLATRNEWRTFDFRVSPVRAGAETELRFVYYQPLEIDTGVGRYVYPLEDGGTDEGASFWNPREAPVEGSVTFELTLKSAHPIADVRMPGFEAAAKVDKLEEGHYRVSLARAQANLNRDLVFYYRLKDGLPGRVELIPYRERKDAPGTFMLVVTPGLDLQPITGGADYTFVLDVSGSMGFKIRTLARGVGRALGELSPKDRFRIIAFSDRAWAVTNGFVAATPEGVREGIARAENLKANGGTDLHSGLTLGLRGLDADRAQSVILVTDAVTNTGVLSPREFHDLMKNVDVRTFGFLMGNNANWPLMKIICDASGGFWAQVSNSDDILGQLLLAKSKITHECLHGAELRVEGVKVFDTTDPALGKVFRGQQLVFFGRYDGPGKAKLSLLARHTGEDVNYTTTFDFPEIDTENPEIERLWAMHRIEALEAEDLIDVRPDGETRQAIRDLAVAYQLVTDETAMVVMSDEAFAEHGIERRNQARVAKENAARAVRSRGPARSRRVDEHDPAFGGRSAPGVGGGAIDPIGVGLGLILAGAAVAARRRRKGEKKS